MKITKVKVNNFRLLRNAEMSFDETSTLIVGRNNSGKTSLTELFRRLFTQTSPSFNLEDFSVQTHEQFWSAFEKMKAGETEEVIRATLPIIEVDILATYDDDEFGLIGDLVVELDPNCFDTVLRARYSLQDGKIQKLFEGAAKAIEKQKPTAEASKSVFYQHIRSSIPSTYRMKLEAVDPNDSSNVKAVEWQKLRTVVQSEFVNAQRGLDDVTHRDTDVLGQLLTLLFKSAISDTENTGDFALAQELSEAVEKVQKDLDTSFKANINGLLPSFELFGYPGLPDPKLTTETILEVERLLSNNTRLKYTLAEDIRLPEAYNGLGSRNLILMLLKLHQFFKAFNACMPNPALQLVFIEEPEAHLHPQMQEVFISQLEKVAEFFANNYNDGKKWPVQFIVTTHSSHMVNKAPFKSMRYFMTRPATSPIGAYETHVKDLRHGLNAPNDEEFLHKYMTLTRCDLLFADKAVLIEGSTERILLPKMIEKLDQGKQPAEQLSAQYLSVIEVGGAYAHIFARLLDFLEVRTLIITDLDSANASRASCMVSESKCTTNACITDWFGDSKIAPSELLKKDVGDKVKDKRRIAYQVPEFNQAACGRSFEQAFMLANPALFSIVASTQAEAEKETWSLAADVDKTDFAIKYAIYETEWETPRYIREGLAWLAESSGVKSKPSGQVSAAA